MAGPFKYVGDASPRVITIEGLDAAALAARQAAQQVLPAMVAAMIDGGGTGSLAGALFASPAGGATGGTTGQIGDPFGPAYAAAGAGGRVLPGMTVYLLPGRYDLPWYDPTNVTIGGASDAQRVTFKPLAPGTVTIDKSMPAFRAPFAPWTKVHVIEFTSASTTAPAIGATVTGGTTGFAATLRIIVLMSGNWAAGNAAGFLVLDGATGAFGAETASFTGGAAAAVLPQPASKNVYRSTNQAQFRLDQQRDIGAMFWKEGTWWPMVALRRNDTSIWQTNQRYDNQITSRWYPGPCTMPTTSDGFLYIRMDDQDAIERNLVECVSVGTTDPRTIGLRIYGETAGFQINASNVTMTGFDWEPCFQPIGIGTGVANVTVDGHRGFTGYFFARTGNGINVKIHDNKVRGPLHSYRTHVSYSGIKGGYTQQEHNRACWLADGAEGLSIQRNEVTGYFDGMLMSAANDVEVGGYGDDPMDYAAARANRNIFSCWDDAWQMYIGCTNVDFHHNDLFGAGLSHDGSGTPNPNRRQNVNVHHNVTDPGRFPIFFGNKNAGVSGVREGVGYPIAQSAHGVRSDASSAIAFAGQPSAGDSFTILGATVTFVAGAPVGAQVAIGGSVAETRTNTQAYINAHVANVKSAISGVQVTAFSTSYPHVVVTGSVSGANLSWIDETALRYAFPWHYYCNTTIFKALSIYPGAADATQGNGYMNLGLFSPFARNIAMDDQHLLFNNLLITEVSFMPLDRDAVTFDRRTVMDGNAFYRKPGLPASAMYRLMTSTAGYNGAGVPTLAAWKSTAFAQEYADTQVYYPPGWEASGYEKTWANRNEIIDAVYRPVDPALFENVVDITGYGLPGASTHRNWRGAVPPAGA